MSHQYAAVGTYPVKFISENGVSNSSNTANAYVQTIIQEFHIISPTTFNYYPYGSTYIVEFGATNGSNFAFTITIDSNDLSGTEVWDAVTRSGNVTIPFSSLNGQVGLKTLTITASNLGITSLSILYLYLYEHSFFCLLIYMYLFFQILSVCYCYRHIRLSIRIHVQQFYLSTYTSLSYCKHWLQLNFYVGQCISF